MPPKNQKAEWLANRKAIAWEPEILISGIVLIGLLQVPQILDNLGRYLNDWGPSIFFTANIDELLIAFLKTSVIFLIIGLIVNLFLRSIWVVMIGMTYLFPKGLEVKKLQFQPFYSKKLEKSADFGAAIITMDRACSYVYSLTFFAFMCVVGIFFMLFVLGGLFMVIYSFFPSKNDFTEYWVNNVLDFILKLFGILLLLDFISLGWFKRVKWISKIYRPFYLVLSFLTLSPLYRNIYYALISKFNKWKVFASLAVLILAICYVWVLQTGEDILFNKSEIFTQNLGVTAYDGYYRDKNPEKVSNWMHTPSMTVDNDVLEIFVAHKAALEDSIITVYQRFSGIEKADIIGNDSVKLAAFSYFYRFEMNGQKLPPISFAFMNYSQYRQKGVVGYIPLDSLPQGQHWVKLFFNMGKKNFAPANMFIYKLKNGVNYQLKPLKNESETNN